MSAAGGLELIRKCFGSSGHEICGLESPSEIEIEGVIAAFRLSVSEIQRTEQCVHADKKAAGIDELFRTDVIESAPDPAGLGRAAQVDRLHRAFVEAQNAAVVDQASQTRVLIGQALEWKT